MITKENIQPNPIHRAHDSSQGGSLACTFRGSRGCGKGVVRDPAAASTLANAQLLSDTLGHNFHAHAREAVDLLCFEPDIPPNHPACNEVERGGVAVVVPGKGLAARVRACSPIFRKTSSIFVTFPIVYGITE